jgi:hypothetical protein
LEDIAWLGDALLDWDLRQLCLDMNGERSGQWVADQRSNEVLQAYLEFDGYDMGDNYSAHHYGTIFEFIYKEDEDFRARYLDRIAADPSAKKIDATGGDICKGFCWQKLFISYDKVTFDFTNNESLTKKQLLQLIAKSTLTNHTFGVILHGHALHLEEGKMKPIDIVRTMVNKDRLG